MATYQGVLSGATNAVTAYSTTYYHTGFQAGDIGILKDFGAFFQPTELKTAGAGDTVIINTFGRLSGGALGENNVVEGNETILNDGTFSMSWNETWKAVRVPSKRNIRQKRSTADFDAAAADSLFEFQRALANKSLHQAVAGAYSTTITFDAYSYSGSNRTFVTGHNTPTAPASARVYRPNSRTNDQTLVSGDEMTCEVLDYVAANIVNSGVNFKRGAGEKIIGIMSARQMLDLRHDAGSAIQWYPNALGYAQGGDASDLKQGTQFGAGYFIYNNFCLFESPYVTNGVNASTSAEISTVHRAIFCGAKSIAHGSPYGMDLTSGVNEGVPLDLITDTFDYKRFNGHATCHSFGIKPLIGADGVTDGVYVVPTYAAAF